MPEFEDFVDSKVAITALVTAAVLSPQGRRTLRRGAVYGTAGVLMARDAVAGLGRGITRGFRGAASAAASGVQGVVQQPQDSTSSAESPE
jgi:hypothetical protein